MLQYFELILMFGKADLIQQFKRSKMGSLWLIINNIIYITTLGVVWTYIFKLRHSEYFPFFALSYLIWLMISSIISDASSLNVVYTSVLKNIKVNPMFFIDRMIVKHLTTTLYLSPVTAVIFFIFSENLLLINFLGTMICFLFLILFCREFAVIIFLVCSRYPDFAKLIPSLLQVVFLVTPILWNVELIVGKEWLYKFNPVYYLIDLVRSPLLNSDFKFLNMCILASISAALCLVRRKFFVRALARVPFWC